MRMSLIQRLSSAVAQLGYSHCPDLGLYTFSLQPLPQLWINTADQLRMDVIAPLNNRRLWSVETARGLTVSTAGTHTHRSLFCSPLVECLGRPHELLEEPKGVVLHVMPVERRYERS